MNLIWRFLSVLFFSRFSSALTVYDESSISFHVLPTDIDVLIHMNNGRYLSLLDLARIDFMIRNKTFNKLKKQGIYPVVASEMIRFKKSLNLFQRFQVLTRFIGCDDKFFYILHYFKSKGEWHAIGIVKARCLRTSTGPISPNEVLKLLDIENTFPPIPDWVMKWQEADQTFYEMTVKENK